MKYLKTSLIFLFISIKYCKLQKPNMDNRRHDVYIAGFFLLERVLKIPTQVLTFAVFPKSLVQIFKFL